MGEGKGLEFEILKAARTVREYSGYQTERAFPSKIADCAASSQPTVFEALARLSPRCKAKTIRQELVANGKEPVW